jgi:putative DNA primase/helicase
MWGSSNNGKRTLVNTINKILNEYCDSIPAESLMASKNKDDKNIALADLPGIRFLSIPEGEEEGRINESLMKLMTGNDWLKTRKLYNDFFRYLHSLSHSSIPIISRTYEELIKLYGEESCLYHSM